MGENKLNDKIPAIPEDAVINVKVSGQFYTDLKTVFNNYLIEDETKESIGVIADNISKSRATSPKEHRLYLMGVLLAAIESGAKEQEVTIMVDREEVISSAGSSDSETTQD